MVKGTGAQIAVDPHLRHHRAAGGNIVHDRAEEDDRPIQHNVQRKSFHRPLRDIPVQRIPLQQGKRQIDARAAQAADEHDPQRFPIFPDIRKKPRNAEKRQGNLLFLCFHQSAASSLLRL